jgi:hypothetical protein
MIVISCDKEKKRGKLHYNIFFSPLISHSPTNMLVYFRARRQRKASPIPCKPERRLKTTEYKLRNKISWLRGGF